MTAPALCEHDRHGRTWYMILNGPHTTDRYVKGWHFHLQGSRHSRSMTQTTRASLTWTLSRPSLRRNVDVRYGSFYMVRLDAGHWYFLLGLSRGQNGIDNRFGGKLVWKELPQHCALYWGLMGVLQNCKPWMMTSIESPYANTLMPPQTRDWNLWKPFFSFGSIAASHGQELGYGDISDEALWVGQLGNMGGWCSGIFENCLMPHIVMEARLGEWCLNAKPNTIGFCKQKHRSLNQHKQDAKIILETADGDKDQRLGLPMLWVNLVNFCGLVLLLYSCWCVALCCLLLSGHSKYFWILLIRVPRIGLDDFRMMVPFGQPHDPLRPLVSAHASRLWPGSETRLTPVLLSLKASRSASSADWEALGSKLVGYWRVLLWMPAWKNVW